MDTSSEIVMNQTEVLEYFTSGRVSLTEVDLKPDDRLKVLEHAIGIVKPHLGYLGTMHEAHTIVEQHVLPNDLGGKYPSRNLGEYSGRIKYRACLWDTRLLAICELPTGQRHSRGWLMLTARGELLVLAIRYWLDGREYLVRDATYSEFDDATKVFCLELNHLFVQHTVSALLGRVQEALASREQRLQRLRDTKDALVGLAGRLTF